jgi:type I protein arginine methyltransferase
MGYFLLYESMLDTVIYARDKWLVPGGVVFPDKAVMYLTAMEDGNVKRERIDFWKDVYGFDMTPIQEIALREPVVDVVDAKALVTDSVPILRLDI